MDWLASGLPREGQEADQPGAGELARHAVPTCLPDARISELCPRVQNSGWDVCVVVNEQRIVLGFLRPEAWAAGPMVTADEAMELGPRTFRPNTPLDDLAAEMREQETDSTLITTSDGVLLGLLCLEDAERPGDGAKPTVSGEASYGKGR
jgi:hypothetical protein